MDRLGPTRTYPSQGTGPIDPFESFSGLAELPSRPSGESPKTPSRSKSQVALNKTESLIMCTLLYHSGIAGGNSL